MTGWQQWRRRVWVMRVLSGAARRWAWRRYVESPGSRAARLEQASLGESGRLVFVCHGNIMRSAFATYVARERFPALSARIVGGGTHAKDGRKAQDVALAVAAQMDLPMEQHSATPIEALALTPRDVIVCMDAMNEANVLAVQPELAPRVFRVGDIVAGRETALAAQALPDRELHDPYGKGELVTRVAFDRLRALGVLWAERVIAGK